MLGQLVGLFREGKILVLIEKILGKDLKYSKKIPFNELVDIRNKCTHFDFTPSLKELEIFFTQLKTLLSELDYYKIKGYGSKSPAPIQVEKSTEAVPDSDTPDKEIPAEMVGTGTEHAFGEMEAVVTASKRKSVSTRGKKLKPSRKISFVRAALVILLLLVCAWVIFLKIHNYRRSQFSQQFRLPVAPFYGSTEDAVQESNVDEAVTHHSLRQSSRGYTGYSDHPSRYYKSTSDRERSNYFGRRTRGKCHYLGPSNIAKK